MTGSAASVLAVVLGLAGGCGGLAAGCGGDTAGPATTTTTPPAAPAAAPPPGEGPSSVPFGEPPRAFVACLRRHGVEPPSAGAAPPAGGPDARMRRALDACAGELGGSVGASPPTP